jgi:hypothetical protein
MYVGFTVFTSFMLGSISFFPLPFSILQTLNLRRLTLHDALCVFSQFSGSCVCSAVVRPEVLWFRVSQFPYDAVLSRQMIPRYIVLADYRRGYRRKLEDTSTFQKRSRLN